jgi:hypothetical protein
MKSYKVTADYFSSGVWVREIRSGRKCDLHVGSKDLPTELQKEFKSWIKTLNRALRTKGKLEFDPNFDYLGFNKEGLRLAGKLQDWLGEEGTVIYEPWCPEDGELSSTSVPLEDLLPPEDRWLITCVDEIGQTNCRVASYVEAVYMACLKPNAEIYYLHPKCQTPNLEVLKKRIDIVDPKDTSNIVREAIEEYERICGRGRRPMAPVRGG